MTARAAFRQSDVTRAVRGIAKAGVQDATIRLRPGGEIVIHIGAPGAEESGGPNEWDEVFDETPPQAA